DVSAANETAAQLSSPYQDMYVGLQAGGSLLRNRLFWSAAAEADSQRTQEPKQVAPVPDLDTFSRCSPARNGRRVLRQFRLQVGVIEPYPANYRPVLFAPPPPPDPCNFPLYASFSWVPYADANQYTAMHHADYLFANQQQLSFSTAGN